MMNEHGFARTIGLGVAAAVSLVFVQQLAAPWMGLASVATLHGAGVLIVYAAWLAPSRRAAFRNSAVALAGATLIFVIAGSLETRWLGLALLLALIRSGLGPAMRPARAIVVELGLLGGGLAMAVWLSGAGWFGQALGLWGYALVQSLYFLVPGRRSPRALQSSHGDPFDRARDRLINLLEEC
jgi:hypothetical protein